MFLVSVVLIVVVLYVWFNIDEILVFVWERVDEKICLGLVEMLIV